MENKEVNNRIVLTVLKFATSSAIATLVDLCLFLFVLSPIMDVFWAEFIAGFVGMTINFFLQKKYVFDLKRNAYYAFALSLGFSLVALILGSYLMKALTLIDLFALYLIVPKIIVVSFKFCFNFLTKRWIFEK